MRLEMILVLIGVLAIAGCRAVVEPGVVDTIRDVRIVDGRIEGLEGAPVGGAILHVSAQSGGDAMDPQSVVMDAAGRFAVEVGRGTRPEVILEAIWNSGSPLQRWFFGPVFLEDRVVLEHHVRPLAGRIVAAELPADAWEGLKLELRELRSMGYDTVSLQSRGDVALDAEGRFETWVPQRQWRLEIDLRSIPGFVWGEVEWWWLDTEADLELSFPIERGRLEFSGVAGLPAGTEVFWEAHGGVAREDERRTSFQLRSIITLDGTESEAWFPTAAFHAASDFSLSRVEGGRSLRGFSSIVVEVREEPGIGRVLRVDAGDHLLRVAIQRSGVPQPGLIVELVDLEGRNYAQTDSLGVAWLGTDAGPKRLGINVPGPADRWYDVIVPDQLDVTFDLDAAAPLTPPAPPPSATTPFRRP